MALKKDAIIRIRVDSDLKDTASKLYEQLGINLTDAINIFLRQSVNRNGLPFNMVLDPNAETIKAIEDAEKGIGTNVILDTTDGFLQRILDED